MKQGLSYEACLFNLKTFLNRQKFFSLNSTETCNDICVHVHIYTPKIKFQPYRIRCTPKCHWNHWFHLNLEHTIYHHHLHIPWWSGCGCQQEPLDLLWRILTQASVLSSQISSFSGSGQQVSMKWRNLEIRWQVKKAIYSEYTKKIGIYFV